MINNEEHTDDTISSKNKVSDTTLITELSSNKRKHKVDTLKTQSTSKSKKTVEISTKSIKPTNKVSKSISTNNSSDMLSKIEERPQTQPPIRVPRIKKTTRKKAPKLNTKIINRVVRFF